MEATTPAYPTRLSETQWETLAAYSPPIPRWGGLATPACQPWSRPPQLGIGGEVGREGRALRVAQPSGVGWGGSFHGLSSLLFGKTAYAMEAP